MPLSIPNTYRPPLGLPLFWQDEQSGLLARAVETYLDHILASTPSRPKSSRDSSPSPLQGERARERGLTSVQLALLRQYVKHFINAPCWDASGFEDELAKLRADVDQIQTVDQLRFWLRECLEIGIDPF